MIDTLLKLKGNAIRFVIIGVIPQGAAKKIRNLSQELFELSGSKTALLYPPHITIRTGAIVPIDHIEMFVSNFSNYLRN